MYVAAPPDVICDVVLLSWNSPEKLRACIEGLLTHTYISSRLIIVDNASAPDVRAWLATVKPRGSVHAIEVIQNERNEGFSRGMNRGIQASRAPYVCLLNNDTVPAPGWLARTIEVAERHQDIGILNPDSNTFGTRPPEGMSLPDYSKLVEPRRGQFVEVGSCIGFCMLIKRSVLERVGLLDDTIGPFFYEDEDYCVRAQQAGFRCVVVPSAYVYHAEHHSVDQLPQREAIYQASRRRFMEKWGRSLRVAYCLQQRLEPGSPLLHQVLQRAVGWARQRASVRVFFQSEAMKDHASWFASVGMIPHMDVMLYPSLRRIAPSLRNLAMILKRRKKPYDLIVTDDEPFALALQSWRWMHHADVTVDSAEEQLRTLWTKRSRSPL
jgi:GT2 family glycosyltransferase